MDKYDIIVVTGLPRSGTSLVMQILHSMGIELFIDNHRPPDQSNPKGYFEHELVKSLQKDTSWLKRANGKAIKIVSPLIKYLPVELYYKIIYIIRDLDEIILSQERMLSEKNIKDDTINSNELKKLFFKDLRQTRNWVNKELHCDYLEIFHSKLLANPEPEIERLKSFFKIDANKTSVLKVIDNKLYRSKVN